MAVTKRARFEVLRRDEFRCQYCGLKSTETGEGLTIDHVVPVALGGSDKPDNLVAACRDCNAGKTSIQPDSPLVQGVSATAVEWALAKANRNAQIDADLAESEMFENEFYDWWAGYTYQQGGESQQVPLPSDWRSALSRWWKMGVPSSLVSSAIGIAMAKQMNHGDRFRYFAGVIWRTLDEYDSASDLQTHRGRVFGPSEVEEIADGRAMDTGRRYVYFIERMRQILEVNKADWNAAYDLAREEWWKGHGNRG